MEKHIETRKYVYHNVIDFKKAFDRVGVMAKHGTYWDISRDY